MLRSGMEFFAFTPQPSEDIRNIFLRFDNWACPIPSAAGCFYRFYVCNPKSSRWQKPMGSRTPRLPTVAQFHRVRSPGDNTSSKKTQDKLIIVSPSRKERGDKMPRPRSSRAAVMTKPLSNSSTVTALVNSRRRAGSQTAELSPSNHCEPEITSYAFITCFVALSTGPLMND